MGDSPPMLRLGRKRSLGRRRNSEMSVPEQTSDNIPKADASALLFLQSLDSADFKNVEFCDRLTTFSDDGKEIGNFFISISASSNGFREGFLVKASSVGKIDGLLCGTKITALISRNMMETIEHRQHDFLFLKDECECLKRDTEILKQANGFLISRCTARAQDVQKTSRFIDQRHAVGLISEAADLILQRILATKGLPQDINLISLDTNANIGSAKYEKLTESVDSGLIGISRTVFPWEEKSMTWHSHLTSRGVLVYRHQIGSAFMMKLPGGENGDNHEVVASCSRSVANCSEREKDECQSLKSNYSNGKTKSIDDSKVYLKQHPELKTITTDFLQLLFIRKPTNVPLFAANYFSALAAEPDSSESTAVPT